LVHRESSFSVSQAIREPEPVDPPAVEDDDEEEEILSEIEEDGSTEDDLEEAA